MYIEGDIIIRTREPYNKLGQISIRYEGQISRSYDVDIGTRGVVVCRYGYGGSSVLILDGNCKGETHSWADIYTEAIESEIIWEV